MNILVRHRTGGSLRRFFLNYPFLIYEISSIYSIILVLKVWRFRMNTFDLDSFFPKEKLQLIKAEQTNGIIHIYLESKTKSCVCPKCGQSTEEYHGTYVRHVQDLPILGKNVQLHIKAHEYKCTNTDCNASTIAENFNGCRDSKSKQPECLQVSVHPASVYAGLQK